MSKTNTFANNANNNVQVNTPTKGDLNQHEPFHYDVAIIGAGPVGLFAVFELGILGLNAVVFDVLDKPGGQCSELYPEKPIYDIPALPLVTGQELTDRLMEQIKPFETKMVLGERVEHLNEREGGGFNIITSNGQSFNIAAVFIAAGAGCFTPRKPKLDGLEAFEHQSFFYSVAAKSNFVDHELVILGGGDSAIDWALDLCDCVKKLTVVHRREQFRAVPASVNALWEKVEQGKIDFIMGQAHSAHGNNGQLSRLDIQTKNASGHDTIISVPCTRALAFFGLNIELGPLANWKFDLEAGKRISVDTEKFETSRKGIFAVGDIGAYPGKLKLILSGFHEVALAAQEAFRIARPDQKLRFQYTTSSSEIQQFLKIEN